MQTNFAALTAEQKLVWSRDLWQEARDMAFITKFTGTDQNSSIQRITELTKTEKGEEAIMHLLADLVGDGVVGDDEREGNEEAMQTDSETITIDLLSHGVVNKGKMADQKTIVDFRKSGKGRLAYWLANRMDQLAFLTMSGIDYSRTNSGALRTDTAFTNLAFAGDVSAPTANRHLRLDASTGLEAGDTSLIEAVDIPTYAHMVDLHAYAKEHYVKPMLAGGKEYYMMFVRPGTLAHLKKDADYQRAVVTGAQRGMDNPWFTGGTITIDGLVFHEHRLVYNTSNATSAVDKWGAGNLVDGTRSLLVGAQALGLADLGPAEWNEKTFQYGSRLGINVDKMFGLVKPKFHSIYDNSVEDFGVIAVDHAA